MPWVDGTSTPRTGAELEALLDLRVINVMAPPYSAIGDGVTDDSTAFTNALVDAQGGLLWVPPGYEFAIADVVILGQTHVLGGSGAISGFPVAASVLTAFAGATRILDGREKYGISIENIYVNGNGIASYGIDLSQSAFGGANQHRITNCSVTGTSVAALMLDNAGETDVRSCRTDQLTSGYAIRWLNQAGNSTISGGSFMGGTMFLDAQTAQISDCAMLGVELSKACEQIKFTNCYIYQAVVPGGTAYCVDMIASPLTPGAVGAYSVLFDSCRFVMKNGNTGEATSGTVIHGDYIYYLGFHNCIVDMVGSGTNPNFFDITSPGGAGVLTMEFTGGRMTNVAGKTVVWNPDYSQYEVRETLTDGSFNFLSNMGVRSVRMREQTDFSAPGANEAILYTRDNGSGKTQIVARFNTGAIQVIATQP